MVSDEPKQSPPEQRHPDPVESAQNVEGLFSPRFKSLAAMAGWDEESILLASLIVEDTPDRQFKYKKRSDLQFKTPPSASSRRKRRAQRKSPVSVSVPVIGLEEEEPEKQENQKEKTEAEPKIEAKEERKTEGDELKKENSGVSCSNSVVPCMDKLREELSCAICLEICFEPSTTSCGHSFCKKCLRSAADKCGKKCPKCRQLISNGRSCTVNTVLWNTIQLLFPQEIEARKAAGALNSREVERQTPETRINTDVRSSSIRPSRTSVSRRDVTARRRDELNQDEDSALAQRLQREDLTRLLSRDTSGRNRRGGILSQDEDAESAQSLPREDLARLLRRDASGRRRRGTPSQDEDAALALRLQREEFMEAFGGTHAQSASSLSLARANLRAMASRAINIRMRSRPT
ncbi:hypothetical protein GH714_041838 [Hevea brasiliensis]|uniref:RING-type E3 ubiquitin transferase n=1 Tax=Hevea brasiliensis TaxID=3981 RepID=A0A6A6MTX8_HEVBR|nr:hypothetical protein GH714_041838 [Hevea brasiliensis]